MSLGRSVQASSEGRLKEMFGVGTACTITPVSALLRPDGGGAITCRTAREPGEQHALAQRLLTAVTDIQYGRVEHPWSMGFE